LQVLAALCLVKQILHFAIAKSSHSSFPRNTKRTFQITKASAGNNCISHFLVGHPQEEEEEEEEEEEDDDDDDDDDDKRRR
jgi:hypothetical protein